MYCQLTAVFWASEALLSEWWAPSRHTCLIWAISSSRTLGTSCRLNSQPIDPSTHCRPSNPQATASETVLIKMNLCMALPHSLPTPNIMQESVQARLHAWPPPSVSSLHSGTVGPAHTAGAGRNSSSCAHMAALCRAWVSGLSSRGCMQLPVPAPQLHLHTQGQLGGQGAMHAC